MADTLTKEQRSQNMAAIKSRRTKPEMFLRHELFVKGYRYRVNVNYIPGHPDMFLRKYNLAIFVNGCFWHRHQDCRYSYMPKSNQVFWMKKFAANTLRDKKVRYELEQKGIRQMIIWECFLNRIKSDELLKAEGVSRIEELISSSETYMEID